MSSPGYYLKNRDAIKAKNAAWREHKRANKLCIICGKQANSGLKRTTCDACQLRKLNQRQSRQEIGLCAFCGKPRIGNQKQCEYHLLASLANGNLGNCRKETVILILELLKNQNYTCPYSGKKLVLGENASIDHKNPRSRFPDQQNDAENIEWVDVSVNFAKRDLTKNEFLALCRTITEYTQE